jgi:hypothetical protein
MAGPLPLSCANRLRSLASRLPEIVMLPAHGRPAQRTTMHAGFSSSAAEGNGATRCGSH